MEQGNSGSVAGVMALVCGVKGRGTKEWDGTVFVALGRDWERWNARESSGCRIDRLVKGFVVAV
jgi:hypothetical protein